MGGICQLYGLNTTISSLVSAPDRIGTFDAVYGADNLAPQTAETGVRVITAAPEIEGVMDSIDALAARGVLFSVGHRYVVFTFD